MKALPALLAFGVLALPIQGRTKHAPLPTQILQAKTADIDNRSGLAAIGDKSYDELSKWGRFRLVTAPKDADVIFLISAQEYVSGYRTMTSGTSHGTVDDSGDINVTHQSASQSRAETSGATFLTVLDPKTGIVFWSDRKAWGSGFKWAGFTLGPDATRSLIKTLRRRIEEVK